VLSMRADHRTRWQLASFPPTPVGGAPSVVFTGIDRDLDELLDSRLDLGEGHRLGKPIERCHTNRLL